MRRSHHAIRVPTEGNLDVLVAIVERLEGLTVTVEMDADLDFDVEDDTPYVLGDLLTEDGIVYVDLIVMEDGDIADKILVPVASITDIIVVDEPVEA